MAETYECVATISTAANCWGVDELGQFDGGGVMSQSLQQQMLEALKGLLIHAPEPKGIKQDFSYTLYLEAARRAIERAEQEVPR